MNEFKNQTNNNDHHKHHHTSSRRNLALSLMIKMADEDVIPMRGVVLLLSIEDPRGLLLVGLTVLLLCTD
jgi:hypothetical protein